MPFGEGLELDAGHEFNHTAGIGFLRFAKGRALDIGARIGVTVGYRLQLKNVEKVKGIHLEAKQRVTVEPIERDLFGEAHVGVEEAGSAEAVVGDAGQVVWGILG